MTQSRNPNKTVLAGGTPATRPAASEPKSELASWLRLTLAPGIGPARAVALLQRFRSPDNILGASHADLTVLIGAGAATHLLQPDEALNQQLALTLSWAEQPDCHLLSLADPGYPEALLQIADPPPLLYLRGQPDTLKPPALGVIGSRHATRAGLDNAAAFAGHLASRGLVVVSGLARGIDAAAHNGAMQNNGLTLAVMGTGIDRIYPAAHQALAADIAASGAILTEMPLGTAARPGHFPRRNRIIAGLSVGVLVVEAARRSGSLITARHALECGREVFAIPGSIHSPVARGCHSLIRQGAKLVESSQDIIDELPPSLATKLSQAGAVKPGDESVATAALPEMLQGLLEHLDWDGMTVEQLRLSVDADQSSQHTAENLLELELAGFIERLPDGRVRRRSAAH